MRRWLNVVTGRVRGLGGAPAKIQPSPLGTANQPIVFPVEPPEAELGETGKIVALRYDRFGDFIGFDLVTLDGGERHFRAREPDVEALVRRAWVERILLTVLHSHHDPAWPREIILRGPPRHE